MIDQKRFVNALLDKKVSFFTGVPDSYLNDFCLYLLENVPDKKHVIAANEGNAMAIASGAYLTTGEIPLVYMQNSGMGNALNPLVSLIDEQVYSIPMIILIGWRGEPGSADYNSHAQHRRQGEITTKLFEMLNIPYVIAEDNDDKICEQAKWAVDTAREEKRVVALIVPKGVFASAQKADVVGTDYPLSRQDAIEIILNTMPGDTIYLATTGRATRELYFLRETRGEGHKNDFLNLGSMGHASSVALGIALSEPERNVVCLDGDAAAIMHLGALTTIAKYSPHNMMHVILNNGVHESVGGQPTAGQIADFTKIAEGAGYRTVGHAVRNERELRSAIDELRKNQSGGTGFIDIRIHKGLGKDLPPLKIDSHELIGLLSQELHTR